MEFILKPVFWNVNNYKKPSGHRVTGKSFPAMYGYGHEEWNGSDKLKILWKGSAVNVFHIEQNSHIGGRGEETIVFMYASHDGVQELVGVAAKAQFLDKLNDRK